MTAWCGGVAERLRLDDVGGFMFDIDGTLLHRAPDGHGVTRRAFVEHILGGIEAVPITEAVARVHAELWVELERLGLMVGAHDLWIAATGVAHGFGVATGNAREFLRVPGLRVVALPG